MGITMRLKQQDGIDLHTPAVQCDICGADIRGPGTFEWRVDDDGRPTGEMLFRHKGCRSIDRNWCSEELTTILRFLAEQSQ